MPKFDDDHLTDEGHEEAHAFFQEVISVALLRALKTDASVERLVYVTEMLASFFRRLARDVGITKAEVEVLRHAASSCARTEYDSYRTHAPATAKLIQAYRTMRGVERPSRRRPDPSDLPN